MTTRLQHVLLAILGVLLPSPAIAQVFPSRPITVVIGYPPGTPNDTVMRPVARDMERLLGQPVVIEHKPGANATIAARYVANAKPDGYTLLLGGMDAIHPLLTRYNAVDAGKELAPVSHLATASFYLISSASLPVSTFQELVAYARKSPKSLRHGSPAPTIDLALHMLGLKTGITSEGIPYPASPQVVIAMLGGDINLGFGVPQAFAQHIQAGKMRALFIASPKRSALLPNVPTAAEAGVADFEVGSHNGLWAPALTPKDIIQKLSLAAAATFKNPAFLDQMRAIGLEPVGSTPEEQLRTFESQMRFWTEAVQRTNFQLPP